MKPSLFGSIICLFLLACGIQAQEPAPGPMVVLKLDDLKVKVDGVPPQWRRVAEIVQDKQIKASVGIICESLAGDFPAYIEWIREQQANGRIEFWFHGYDHQAYTDASGLAHAELHGRSYEEQKERFEKSEALSREKLGFPLETFGPPGGGKTESMDETTLRVITESPDIKVVLYPKPADDGARQLASGGKAVLDRVFSVNIEQPLFQPNFEMFRKGWEAHQGRRQYFVIQGHPGAWTDEGFAEFLKIVEYVQAHGGSFVTPRECAAKIASPAP